MTTFAIQRRQSSVLASVMGDDVMNETEGNNVVPLFKTFEQLREQECEIFKSHYDAWHAAYRRWDLVKAAIADDENELTKLAAGGDELALAKSDAVRLRKSYNPELSATCELASALRALCERRNERLFGLGTLAKRSMRFASAHERRNYGSGAESLPPAS
jgi:hypothetical protein